MSTSFAEEHASNADQSAGREVIREEAPVAPEKCGRTKTIMLLVGASVALSLAATGLVVFISSRQALRGKRRLTATHKSPRGYVARFARPAQTAAGQMGRRLTSLVSKR